MSKLIFDSDGWQPAGLETQLDYPHPQAADPRAGENFGFWFFDEAGTVGVHAHVQREEGLWSHAREMIHVFLGNGRFLRAWGSGSNMTATDVGGANIRAECIDPFRKWRFTFRGIMFETTAEQAVTEYLPDRGTSRNTVEIDLSITTAAPPWFQGSLSESAREDYKKGGQRNGGLRYEQLLWVKGVIRVDGSEHSLSGGGLRTHRYGVRDLSTFGGHTWASAVFADGTGFGYMALQGPGGGPYTYEEGFVLSNGTLLPAEIVKTPGQTELIPIGETFEIVLESSNGRHSYKGEVIHNCMHTIVQGGPQPAGFEVLGLDSSRPDNVAVTHSGVHYTSGTQTTVNMMERGTSISALPVAE